MFAGVVVLYNPNKEIIKNINSYIEYIDKLYVVDNSSNNNKTLINKIIENKKIEYIPNYSNLGIAKALNIGAEKAINEKFNYLLTMDQDSDFSGKNLLVLINMIRDYNNNKILIKKFGKKEKIGIFSPLHVINNDEKILGVPQEEFDSPINVMTSGNIINLDIYKKIGGFNEDYFIDCVDFEYCLKMRKNGFTLIRNNKSKLNHELGNLVKKNIFGKVYKTFEHNYLRRYYIVRNRNYLCKTYMDDFPEYCKLEKKCTLKELKLVWICEKNKIKKTYYMLKGYIDFKLGRAGKKDE